MIVFLCGMMGSGKSSLGKKIASKMHWDFIDLDILIEEEEKKQFQKYLKILVKITLEISKLKHYKKSF